MKTLTPTNLIAVEVPKDATDYFIKIDTEGYLLNYTSKGKNKNIDFGYDDFKIIGEVTDTEISFDLKKLDQVSLTIKQSDELLNENDKIDFRLLLQSNGLYFENPMVKPNPISFYETPFGYETEGCFDNAAYNSEMVKWQSYESKLIKGKLIILKQK